ncbi:molecular chaperone [Vibrio aestuarianus]|uniref:molecular chaperone n=1 Tax=Vibrio aestuarianus TaxID=28171 RepID=UPI00337C4DE9|nr:Pilus assembly protein [Vibrio aestuarianus]
MFIAKYLGLFALLMMSSVANAYKVQPMVAEITPIGKGSQMTMRIDNTSQQPLTVEFIPLSMSMDEMGNETTKPADDDLLVIPVTAIIPPGRSQSVMVRYLGNPSISQSQSYRIAVKQVKVERADTDETASIGVLMQFNTLLNVRPKNTNPAMKVERVEQKDGKWLVEITNDGKSYGRLSKTNWRITDHNQSLFLPGSDISKFLAGTLILPKSKRIFVMQPLEGFDAQSTSIEIENID